jgi:hypothetical protein
VAERIEKFSTVAAIGASGVSVPHTFLEGTVTRVELYVPNGHAGLTAWSFWFGTAQLIPYTAGGTIVANDRQFEWDLENAPTGSGYKSVVSNSDVYAHSFHVQIWLVPIDAPLPVADQLPILVLPLAE